MIIENTPIKALVFDWGDTLMQVFPEYDGPMKDWPKVAEVEGARQCLAELHSHYRLFIGTNAAASNRESIRAALEMVGLSEFIEEIYGFTQLNCRKPELRFFAGLEEALGLKRSELMMVGDSFEIDVLGGWGAGWRTAWLNPSNRQAPGLLPVQDIDISRLVDLPAKLREKQVPSLNDCLAWHLERGASLYLLNHVKTVAAGAYRMALWLRAAGQLVDPLLAHRGGLLHDLAKTAEKKDGPDHGLLAAELLREQDLPELAEMANRHMLFGLLDPERRPQTWEQKVVYLADKYTEGSRFVTLDERMQALRQRYRMDPAEIAELEPELRSLQAELCEAINIEPVEIAQKLTESALS